MISRREYAQPGAVVAEAAQSARRARVRLRENVEGLVWVAPAFIYLAFFIAYPFVMSIFLSLSSARVGSPEWHYTGFTNFQRIFADPTFWQTVRNSFIFTFGSEAIRLVIGLPLAFALNRSFKGKRLVQGVILIPFVIPIALSSLAWKWMFDSLYSVINWMLMTLHIIDYPWQWLGEPGLAMWSVIILNVWRVMEATPHHHYQILTKRPERMAELTQQKVGSVLPNVWLGTSIEDANVASRADVLRAVPAAIRFISFEPLIGSVGKIQPECRNCRLIGTD